MLASFILAIDRTYFLDTFKNANGEDFWWRSRSIYYFGMIITTVRWVLAFNVVSGALEDQLFDIVTVVSSFLLIAEPSILSYIDYVETI
ncbi:hypothetical protein FGO68_gene16500 [Halteria grandinella]|uniref:Uncharacterized protein n=1 Tax=Halteria grandinella TaxID=5974 RepID=A0A8J8SZH2_HALGN|nr:hypothetical protein FGO68_gene16500 [Halteria grandinella]